jgi:hypothetical protein
VDVPVDASCPVCLQTDAVRTVQGLVADGTSSSRSTGLAGGMAGRSPAVLAGGGASTGMSDLARRLAAPEPPRTSGAWLVMIYALLGPLIVAFAITGGREPPDWLSATAVVVGLGLVFGVVRPWNLRQAESARARWQERYEAWTTLRYCYRDDVVWHPGERRAVRPEGIAAVLDPDG